MSALRDLYLPELSEHDAAVHALKALKVPESARSVLLPLVVRDVQLFRRVGSHSIEQHVPIPSKQNSDPKTSPLLRAELLSETFALGDGRRVRWGEATAQDHQDRIDFLTKQIRGTQQTIGRHAAAIELISTANVSCLDEVTVEAVAA